MLRIKIFVKVAPKSIDLIKNFVFFAKRFTVPREIGTTRTGRKIGMKMLRAGLSLKSTKWSEKTVLEAVLGVILMFFQKFCEGMMMMEIGWTLDTTL